MFVIIFGASKVDPKIFRPVHMMCCFFVNTHITCARNVERSFGRTEPLKALPDSAWAAIIHYHSFIISKVAGLRIRRVGCKPLRYSAIYYVLHICF